MAPAVNIECWSLVAGEGASPKRAHFEVLAKAGDVKRPEAVNEQVRAAINRFGSFAGEASVPVKPRQHIAKALGVPSRVSRSPSHGHVGAHADDQVE